jgi:hypothetical protein
MKNSKQLDLYGDYLISAFNPTTETELSLLLDDKVSHEQIQRFLAGEVQPEQTSAASKAAAKWR